MIITRRVEDTTLNVHIDDIQFEKIQRKSRKYKKSSELMKKTCEKAYHIMNYGDDLGLILSIWFLFIFAVTFAAIAYFATIARLILLIVIILGSTVLYFGIIFFFEYRFFNYGYYLAEEALKDLLNENIGFGFRDSDRDVVEISELGVDTLPFWFVSHENIHKTYDFMLITGKRGKFWFDLINKE